MTHVYKAKIKISRKTHLATQLHLELARPPPCYSFGIPRAQSNHHNHFPMDVFNHLKFINEHTIS
jgi:hypothetical protein